MKTQALWLYRAGAILFALVALCLAQSISDRHAVRYDCTEEERFGLSDASLQLLDSIDAPLVIYAFMQMNDEVRIEAEALLRQVQRRCSLIEVRIIDPVLEPAIAIEYGVERERILVFVRGKRRVQSRGLSESHIVSGLRRLLRSIAGRVLFLTGHGEADMLSIDRGGVRMFAESLVFAGLSVDPLIFYASDVRVPDDCVALVIAAPRDDLAATELNAIDAFLARGGGLLLMIEDTPGPRVSGLLESWGVHMRDAWALDPVENVHRSPGTPLITRFRDHPVSRQLESVVLSTVRPLVAKSVSGSWVTPLLLTSRHSWGETARSGTASFSRAEDIAPPLTVALAVERRVSRRESAVEKTARLVVVGDGHIASNGLYRERSNAEFSMAAVEWLAGYGEREVLLPKRFLTRTLYLSPGQSNMLFAVVVIGMPLLALACALWVWDKRR